LEGAVKLSIELTFPLTKGDESTKAKREQLDIQDWFWLTQRPDATNLTEAIQDQMTKLRFVFDDSQFVWVIVKKKRGRRVGVAIELREIE